MPSRAEPPPRRQERPPSAASCPGAAGGGRAGICRRAGAGSFVTLQPGAAFPPPAWPWRSASRDDSCFTPGGSSVRQPRGAARWRRPPSALLPPVPGGNGGCGGARGPAGAAGTGAEAAAGSGRRRTQRFAEE